MKLELKHLAGYLPYGLKVQVRHGWCTMLTLNDWSINCDCEEAYGYETLEETDFKPILRPLSDLTKEINGICYWLLIDPEEMCYFRKTGCNLSKLSVKSYFNLLEHHFDIYGLIPAGLAMDINTLNK